MVLMPVDSVHHVHLLREYRNLLQSTMGPRGSCKALVTGGGYLEVAATSAALAARLELANPVCKFINNVVAGQTDHGLYCGVLLTHLLEQLWQEPKLTKRKSSQATAVLVKELKQCLMSENVCVKLEFDSIKNLLPLVRTKIKSKISVLLSELNVDGLCLEIIKVFLNCVDEDTNMINRVYIKVESGLNTFVSYKGLLYSVTDTYVVDVAKAITDNVQVLVFTLKLEDHGEFAAYDEFKKILDYSVNVEVKIVACQKTVSSEIKLLLRRKKIILLERMGTDFTRMLIDISNAFPISELNIKETEMKKMIGNLSSMKHVQFNDRDYLVLHNENLPVGTLLVQTSSMLGEDFVKALISQAFSALRTAAAQPLLTPGGGCLETWLIGQIHRLKMKRAEQVLSIVSTWVQRALRLTCSTPEMDTVYHHCWGEGELHCCCRMVRRSEVEQRRGAWLTLREVVNSPVTLEEPHKPNMTLRPDVLVDCHHHKYQVICTVFEAFANLSDIGLIALES